MNKELSLIFIVLVSLNSVNALEYFHSNHLNSPVLITDEEGNLVENINYEPYGNSENDERYKFNDKEDDGDLYYYESRYYDDSLGRFVQPDSIIPSSDPEHLNRYSYVRNNPVNRIDPSGGSDEYWDDFDLLNPDYAVPGLTLGIDINSIQYSDPYENLFVDEFGDFNIDTPEMALYNGIVGSIQPINYATTPNGLDALQLTLAGLGMTEPFGFIFDGIDGCVSLCRGDKIGAGMSAVAFVPGFGAAAGGTKITTLVKTIEMPDLTRLDPNTLVVWVKEASGKPSTWSTGDNFGIFGTKQAIKQQRAVEAYRGYGDLFKSTGELDEAKNYYGYSLEISTAQEFVDQMKKWNLLGKQ
jgi:RHS repeat-associated protein